MSSNHTTATVAALRDGVEMPRALMPAKRSPFRLRAARGLDGGADIIGGALRDICNGLSRRRIADGKAAAGLGELTIDEMPEAVAVVIQPFAHDARIFRCRAVFHGLQDIRDLGHVALSLCQCQA